MLVVAVGVFFAFFRVFCCGGSGGGGRSGGAGVGKGALVCLPFCRHIIFYLNSPTVVAIVLLLLG